jgi:hypothetical protein
MRFRADTPQVEVGYSGITWSLNQATDFGLKLLVSHIEEDRRGIAH